MVEPTGNNRVIGCVVMTLTIPAAFRRWLVEAVSGYWPECDEDSGGNSSIDGRFQPRAAWVAAFAEVEFRGDDACGPAQVPYRLLVEGVRGRSMPR